jgi:hypothetical protein
MENSDKNYIIIKLPLKVENTSKALSLLGTSKEIYEKVNSDKDLDFDFFYNKLTLENYFSNDILIKRKTYRHKKEKNKKKYKYFIMGKITNILQSSNLENFIYINEEKNSLSDLNKYIIQKDEYENERNNKNLNSNEESKTVSNLIKKKYKENNKDIKYEGNDIQNFFKFIQPNNFANSKNSSQNIPKLIKNKFKIDDFNINEE